MPDKRWRVFRHDGWRLSGFSLVELMIAMTLGLLLTAAVGALFFANKRNYEQNSKIAEMQDNARFALQALSRDLGMAGFRGGMTDASQLDNDSDTLPLLAGDCGPGADGEAGWAFDRPALEFQDDVAPSAAAAVYGCLASSDVAARTDLLTVRRAAGLATDEIELPGEAPSLRANTFYLRTNRTVGSLFFSGADAANPDSGHPPDTPPMSFWEYDSRLYFIRPFAATAGDGIPTLCRAYLASGGAGVETECVAEGVENFQIAFGIDTDGDGIANRYLAEPTADQLARAVTARIQLLMRAVRPDYGYTNGKRYNLLGHDDDGDGAVDEAGEGYRPQDNFYRRVAQTTVILHNPALAQGFNP